MDLLCIALALFNKIKFTVELWQENDIDTTGFAVCFKQALDSHKIWLIIKNAMAAAICLALIRITKLGIALGLPIEGDPVSAVRLNISPDMIPYIFLVLLL